MSPLVAPPGGFTLEDIQRAYVTGVLDGRAYPHYTTEDLDRAADGYVKTVAVEMPVPDYPRFVKRVRTDHKFCVNSHHTGRSPSFPISVPAVATVLRRAGKNGGHRASLCEECAARVVKRHGIERQPEERPDAE